MSSCAALHTRYRQRHPLRTSTYLVRRPFIVAQVAVYSSYTGTSSVLVFFFLAMSNLRLNFLTSAVQVYTYMVALSTAGVVPFGWTSSTAPTGAGAQRDSVLRAGIAASHFQLLPRHRLRQQDGSYCYTFPLGSVESPRGLTTAACRFRLPQQYQQPHFSWNDFP